MGFIGSDLDYECRRAAIASESARVCASLGIVVASKGYSYRFQSNSTRSRRVLSYFYLGKRAIHTDLNIPKANWNTTVCRPTWGLGMLIKFVGIPQDLTLRYPHKIPI
ncbi:hypothetical protein MSP8886_00437 [Marinomonas spartinae]|uniref:Uncharacterized protein n=1 Tax=Marinomonas spartinae TaxID=1792290 RepID=A0A1A8T492_9GAMM|nr:hypothetical protein MSP8886_00437 [Marinomonas spartinae]